MTLYEKQILFAENMSMLVDHIFTKGYKCTIGEVLRTPEQAAIYAAQGKGIINSLHLKKLAVDLNIFSSDNKYPLTIKDLEQFGRYWEGLHKLNRWGGRFKDRPDSDHFEMQDL